MIRLATQNDAQKIAKTYDDLLTFEKSHQSFSNWQLGIYPTIKVPMEKIPKCEMYVLESGGEICASMVLNSEQAEEYKKVPWEFAASPNEVLVIHTLCVPPEKSGHGFATKMLKFAMDYARKNAFKVIRLDTYAHNEPAKSLYQKHGFRIPCYGEILLQGLIHEEQVYLEWKVE